MQKRSRTYGVTHLVAPQTCCYSIDQLYESHGSEIWFNQTKMVWELWSDADIIIIDGFYFCPFCSKKLEIKEASDW